MKTVRRWINRLLRGPASTRLLKRLGVNPHHYWLLNDLFGELAERREMMGNLGSNKSALKLNAWILCGMTGLMTIGLVVMQMPPGAYLGLFLAVTALLMLGMLFSETGNSLVNPVEGLVLAHQPIDGATYTAAKLTHLMRILIFLVPALNGIPAICGLLIGAPWFYPLVHLGLAFLLSLVIALFCCATFGWLMRFVPAQRLKIAGQVAEILPWSLFMLFQYSGRMFRHVNYRALLPSSTGTIIWVASAAVVLGAAAVYLGLRNLSADYLVRISAIAHGGSGARSKLRQSRINALVGQFFGGPPARAGYDYLSRMMRRDWQFRRQLLPLIPSFGGLIFLVAQNWRKSPFSGEFTGMHVVPHFFGMVLFIVCPLLQYGSDYKGAWLFLLAPAGVFRGFTRGLHAFLWLRLIVTPHVLLLAVGMWLFGPAEALVFTAYSLAVASFYLSLEFRLIEAMPFSRQPQPTRQNYLLPIMAVGMLVMAIVVGLQYLFLFHSMVAVLTAAVLIGIAAWLLTRRAVEAVEIHLRYDLSTLADSGKTMFKEVEA